MEAEACFLQTRNRDTERLQCPGVMLKAQPLGTRAESNFRDRTLVEVEKNSSVSLPGKGGHRNCYSQKMCVPTQEDMVRSFMTVVQEQGCLEE